MMTVRMTRVAAAGILIHGLLVTTALAQRQMEALGRGVVAIRQDGGKVFVGWRLLGTDPDDIAFNVYRATGGAAPVKLNPEPLRNATNFVDGGATSKEALSYFVRPVQGSSELGASAPYRLRANDSPRPYISIPLETLPGHTPNDASVGDLDGDGEYEIVLKQEMRGRDNSQAGTTGETKLEAYTLYGRFLWRINLGKNIREGAHYTQFMVYDLDGDGKAEVVCKTADGTVDGKGTPIGDATADYRNASGFILEGPEFLTVFEGATGQGAGHDRVYPAPGQSGRLGRQPRQPGRPLPRRRCVSRWVTAERDHVPGLLHENGARRVELEERFTLAGLDLRQRRRHSRQPGVPGPGEPQPARRRLGRRR